jgi:ABC-type lipoprotein export system ATPase subunit
MHITRESPIESTGRVMQLRGMFDIPAEKTSRVTWDVSLQLPETWNVGLIVGPSGSGKSTIAREFFGEHLVSGFDWPTDKAVIDGFPTDSGIKDITALLSSVGFSSPPSWLRPFHVLSNGEQFRVTMARALSEQRDRVVLDEFTSVVDRNVAQIGSAAVAKTVRRRNQQLIAVSCHYDIIDWLEPDWIYQPATNEFSLPRGSLQRPPIELKVSRVHHSAWNVFRRHHYLDTSIHPASVCYVAAWRDVPVAFSSWMFMPSGTVKNAWREHRTVTLPDFQGVGIGNALSAYVASMWRGLGKRAYSATSHPAMTRSRASSPLWRVTRSTSFTATDDGRVSGHSTSRLTTGFEYIGLPMDKEAATQLYASRTPPQADSSERTRG